MNSTSMETVSTAKEAIMHDINIYPTPEEQRLLEQKAAEKGMNIEDFVAWLLRQALTQTDRQVREIVKN